MTIVSRIPATMMERQHWYLSQLSPESTAYTIPIVLQCKGNSDVALLQQTIVAAIAAEEIYRTGFVFEDRTLYQVIYNTIEQEIPVVKANATAFSSDDAVYTEQIRKTLFARFDLVNGPLVRCSIVTFSDNEIVIVLAMHHVIADLETVRILLEDVSKRYNSPKSIHAINKQSLSYRDFTQEHLKWLDGQEYHQMQDFWEKEIATINNHSLLFELHRQNETEPLFSGCDRLLEISTDLSEKIKSTAKSLRVSPFTVILAIYYIILLRYTGRNQITVGVPFTNRRNELLEETPGEFANILPMVITFDRNENFKEVVRRIRQKLLQIHRNQEMPLESIAGNYSHGSELGTNPLYQVGCTFEPEIEIELQGALSQRIHVEKKSAQLDLYAFFRYDTDKNIHGYIEYSAAFGEKRADEIADAFKAITTSVLEDTDCTLSAVCGSVVETNAVLNGATTGSLPLQNEKLLEKKQSDTLLQIVVAATFTANTLSDSFGFWIDRLNLGYTCKFADYGQLMQELLNPSSMSNSNKKGFNVVLIRLDDFVFSSASHKHQVDKTEIMDNNVQVRCNEICNAVEVASKATTATFIIVFCPSAPHVMLDPQCAEHIINTHTSFAERFNSLAGVFAITAKTIFKWYPVTDYHDEVQLEHGHIPYTTSCNSAIATAIIRLMFVLQQKPVKVLAIDCDNTLWKGVAAEDGPEGVDVGGSYRTFQTMLVEQQVAGRLLTLVSKNNEEDVEAVFSRNKAMVLAEKNIFAKKINWKPKSQSIQLLAEEVNIGLNGFMFIDDNPIECSEVEMALPEAIVVRFPTVQSEIPAFLNGLWMLDTIKTTKEDLKRMTFYEVEKQRNVVRSQAASFVEFIEKLELEVFCDTLTEDNGERLSQLSYRTNQFNFSGAKYSYNELSSLQKEGCRIIAVSVKDRFGDYGIVGMMVCRFRGNTGFIEQLLLSCRVLGRGVEYCMVRDLGRVATENGAIYLKFIAAVTSRNKPAINFLDDVKRQSSSAVYDNIHLTILVKDIANISFVKKYESGGSERLLSEQTSTDTSSISQDSSNPNRQYNDILKNLSTIDQVVVAVNQYIQGRNQAKNVQVTSEGLFNNVENDIAAIWKMVLQVEQVALNVNFFDLGGVSLQLPQVLAEMQKKFKVEMSLVDLFKYPTIKSIGNYLNSMLSSAKNVVVSDNNKINKRLTAMSALRQRQIKLRQDKK